MIITTSIDNKGCQSGAKKMPSWEAGQLNKKKEEIEPL